MADARSAPLGKTVVLKNSKKVCCFGYVLPIPITLFVVVKN
jgi:hypothetical protein